MRLNRDVGLASPIYIHTLRAPILIRFWLREMMFYLRLFSNWKQWNESYYSVITKNSREVQVSRESQWPAPQKQSYTVKQLDHIYMCNIVNISILCFSSYKLYFKLKVLLSHSWQHHQSYKIFLNFFMTICLKFKISMFKSVIVLSTQVNRDKKI